MRGIFNQLVASLNSLTDLEHKNQYLSPLNEGLKPFVGTAFPNFPSYVCTELMAGLLCSFYLHSQGQTVFLQLLLFSQPVQLNE